MKRKPSVGTPVSAKLARHNLPFPPNPDFCDPNEMLPKLHTVLQQALATAITQPAIVHGLGGVGKTQIAISYA